MVKLDLKIGLLLLRTFVFGDIRNNAAELIGRRPEGRHFKRFIQLGGILFEKGRFTRERHLAVGLDPEALGIGQHFQNGTAHDFFSPQAG